MSEQHTLDGLASSGTVAERAFCNLHDEWREIVEKASPDRPLPRRADTVSFAALLVAVEFGGRFSSVVNKIARSCHDLRPEPFARLDRLPWELSEAALSPSPGGTAALENLTDNLDHHSSGIRRYHLEVAWFVRHWIDKQAALSRLFQNIAGTLSGVTASAALAAELCASEEAFWSEAEAFEPEARFEDQYRFRLNLLGEVDFSLLQADFHQLEALVRKTAAAMVFDDPT